MNRLSGYIVKLKKNVFVEEDPSRTCRNYPTPDFESYLDCDDRYVKERFKAFFPGLNLTPPWLTENLDIVTREPVNVDFTNALSNPALGHNSAWIQNTFLAPTSVFMKQIWILLERQFCC